MEARTENKDNEGSLSAGIDAGEGSSWGPTAPDGGPRPETVHMAEPAEALPFSPANVACLRNCRHYFQATSHFDAGNPAGTFGQDYVPTQRHHACAALPGVYLELSADAPIYECNRWDPLNGSELQLLVLRREKHYRDHPEHRPVPIGDPIEDDEEPELEEDDDERDPGIESTEPDDRNRGSDQAGS